MSREDPVLDVAVSFVPRGCLCLPARSGGAVRGSRGCFGHSVD